MKTPPPVRVPRLFSSDYSEAKASLGRDPQRPVGVVLSPSGFAELASYGCRFPCPVAVDPTAPRETVAWFWLPENFQPYSDLVRAE